MKEGNKSTKVDPRNARGAQYKEVIREIDGDKFTRGLANKFSSHPYGIDIGDAAEFLTSSGADYLKGVLDDKGVYTSDLHNGNYIFNPNLAQNLESFILKNQALQQEIWSRTYMRIVEHLEQILFQQEPHSQILRL